MSQAADLYCVMGNPVAHSRSPAIHARFAELTGEHIAYERRLVPMDGFAQGVRDFVAQGGRGCNVTVPFKTDAPLLATECSERVQLAGAANTLTFRADGSIYADNTDGLGLVADITRNAGVSLAGRDVLLVGAGGAAAGVLGPLLLAGARHITVANRTLAKAQALIERHRDVAGGTDLSARQPGDCGEGYDVVINATASSLQGDVIPVGATVLAPGTLALDMMYGPAAQGFLTWAASHGARGRDGLGMLVEQAAEAFFVWRGVRPDTAPVLAALRERLAAKAR